MRSWANVERSARDNEDSLGEIFGRGPPRTQLKLEAAMESLTAAV